MRQDLPQVILSVELENFLQLEVVDTLAHFGDNLSKLLVVCLHHVVILVTKSNKENNITTCILYGSLQYNMTQSGIVGYKDDLPINAGQNGISATSDWYLAQTDHPGQLVWIIH